MRGSNFRQRKRARIGSKNKSLVPVSVRKAESNLAQKVVQLSKYVKGLKPEVKYITATTSFANVADTVGAVANLVPIPAGTNFTERVGDKIRVKSIYCRLRVATNTGSLGVAPSDDEFTRFCIVQDTQAISSTGPVASDVVYSVTTPQDPIPNIASQPGRFRWLWTSPLMHHAKMCNNGLQGAITTPFAPTQSPVVTCRKYVDIPVSFNTVGAANTQKNVIYLVCWTNLAADTLDVDFTFRIGFTDV